jgi:hypothetical protein
MAGGFSTEITSNRAISPLVNASPSTLRHTAATWLMQRGAPMWEAAGFLGMSEKTLRDTYGRHHPAHLRGAADAIASRPAQKKEALVVSLVEEKAKRKGPLQAPDILGGPGRTRTCNQTVMSGSADYSIVDFLQFLAAINCIRSRSDRSFLVRNWCGSSRRGSSQYMGK